MGRRDRGTERRLWERGRGFKREKRGEQSKEEKKESRAERRREEKGGRREEREAVLSG